MARLPEPDSCVPLPEPRAGWLLALTTCVVATMLLGWPALVGKFLVTPVSDQYYAGYPFREFASQVLRSTGGFALWNPYQFGGMPFVAAMHGDIFYPTFLLREALPTDVAMTWGYLLHMFLAGWATWLFARAMGLSFLGALVAGLAYMLSGWIASYVSPGHDGKLFVSALHPLALWLLLRGIRDGRLWAWGGLAITVGLGALSPHPQLLQYMLVGCGLFGLWVAFGMGTDSPPRPVAVRRLAFALGAVVLGGAISAIQYLPVAEYTPWSPRVGRDYEFNTSFSFPPAELISTLVPEFSGILDAYFGRNRIHLHSEYVGAVTWLLIVAAFRPAARTRQTWLWVGTVLFFTLWALGGSTPFYRVIWAVVPGTKFFRAPSTVFFVAQFALAMLAGLGLDGLLRKGPSRRFVLAGVGAIAALALLSVTGMLGGLSTGFAAPGGEMAAEANREAVTTGGLRAALFAALGLALAWAVGARRLRPAAFGALIAAVLVIDQWTVLRAYWKFSEPAAVLYRTDPTIDYIKAQTATEPGRVLALRAGDGLAPQTDAMLDKSGLMVHGVRQVMGYHGNELARYQTLIGGEGQAANLIEGFNANVYRMLNIRWILSGIPDLSGAPFPGGAPRRVAGPVRNATGSMVYLHELQQPAPFAWVSPAIVKAPDDGALQTILDPRFPVASVALFDTAAAVTARTDLTGPPPELTLPVRVTRYAPGAIDLELGATAPAGSALVVSENYYPGWTATVDGRPATAARAQYSLIGVPLDAGARRVSLRFVSASYERGKTITLVAFAASILLLAAGLVAGRRRSPGDVPA